MKTRIYAAPAGKGLKNDEVVSMSSANSTLVLTLSLTLPPLLLLAIYTMTSYWHLVGCLWWHGRHPTCSSISILIRLYQLAKCDHMLILRFVNLSRRCHRHKLCSYCNYIGRKCVYYHTPHFIECADMTVAGNQILTFIKTSTPSLPVYYVTHIHF